MSGRRTAYWILDALRAIGRFAIGYWAKEATEAVTVLLGKGCFGGGSVHLRSLKQEREFVGVHLHGEVIDTAERESRRIGRFAIGYKRLDIGYRGCNEVGMLVDDGGLGGAVAIGYFHMDIEQTWRIVIHLDSGWHAQHILFGICHRFRCSIAQYLQHIFGFADRSTEGNSDRKACHTRIGDTHREGILIHVLR